MIEERVLLAGISIDSRQRRARATDRDASAPGSEAAKRCGSPLFAVSLLPCCPVQLSLSTGCEHTTVQTKLVNTIIPLQELKGTCLVLQARLTEDTMSCCCHSRDGARLTSFVNFTSVCN